MQTILIASACLACTGSGRRVLTWKEPKAGNVHEEEHQHPQKALASLLASSSPTTGWQVTGLDSRLTASSPKRPGAGPSLQTPLRQVFMQGAAAVPDEASATSVHAEEWRPAGEELSDADVEPRKKSQDHQFLIGNKWNNVSKLACTTKDIIRQGVLETKDLPHVCICGESNAGKSSLINHLLKKDNMAKASSTAGKTRSVDMLLVNDRIVLTDLPGLPSRDGQVTEMWDRTFQPLIMDYVKRCDSLLGMIYTHDIRWKVSPMVRQFLSEIRDQGVPVVLALTKDDRVDTVAREPTPTEIHKARVKCMTRIRKALKFQGVHVHYSTRNELADSRKARKILLRYIESMVKAGSREESKKMLDSHGEKFADLTIRVPKKSKQEAAPNEEILEADSMSA
mmetsp:Transcript_43267/g.80538  ORF Transcript_43267/g.80538 Transcript_43267/m.80538 type:complete len:396 (+) Transcript_43267:45-1232(+)